MEIVEKLLIYNTLSRKKETFKSLKPGFVGIYVCGPTVYDHSHLGHAKSYISFDVIVRYFRYLGYKVRYVQNITDVGHLLGDTNEGEDRIEKQARLEKLEPMEVVETYMRSYFEDMDTLGCVRPDISPRASGHIIEQIELIKILLAKNYAYEIKGNVYFDVNKFSDYGILSGRKIDELEAGYRIDVAIEKRHPADFALWKRAEKNHLMQWDSPWGKGYPGWHLECSCMSTKYLGESFDIHGGGLENIFPHHECEIAQSEAAFGKQFVKYWMHNKMLTIDGVKMGKSLNNFITIKDAVKKYNPLAIRYFILTSHYRSVLDFSEIAIEAADKGLKKIHGAYTRILRAYEEAKKSNSDIKFSLSAYEQSFRHAMNDDFNTPQALAALFDFISHVNKFLDTNLKEIGKNQLGEIKEILTKTAGFVLGILPDEQLIQKENDVNMHSIMELILNVRNELRKEKNFLLADKIRKEIEKIGLKIKDTEEGSTWEME